MVMTSTPFSVDYAVQNIPAVSRVLRGMPEFARGVWRGGLEEFIWMVPQGGGVSQPVATVRLSDGNLRLECQSRHALRAMQVLIDSLVGAHLIPKEAARAR
ncbi:MAG: hypothetical protein M5U26_19175 [Planctomycetota bacterium]|nr:hypothetical protein [Planctomycetota bacterium]